MPTISVDFNWIVKIYMLYSMLRRPQRSGGIRATTTSGYDYIPAARADSRRYGRQYIIQILRTSSCAYSLPDALDANDDGNDANDDENETNAIACGSVCVAFGDATNDARSETAKLRRMGGVMRLVPFVVPVCGSFSDHGIGWWVVVVNVWMGELVCSRFGDGGGC